MNIRSFGSSALAITFAASILASATAACTVKTTGTGPAPSADGGKSSDDDDDDDKDPKPSTGSKNDGGKPSTSTGSSSCQEIFSCAADCTEEGCEETCYEKGSTAARGQVDAVVACAQANGCEDDECLVANCSAEVEACE